MKKDFDHCESVYWVFTQLCNDQCDHCYNLSGPQGSRITEEECLAIIQNLPGRVDRLILSGGEPLAERKKLYLVLDALREKYGAATQLMLQTNGDLLTGEILDTLIAKGVTRFDIASIDRYHKHAGGRLMELAELFDSRGVAGDERDPLIDKDKYLLQNRVTWGYWGLPRDVAGRQLGPGPGPAKEPLEKGPGPQLLRHPLGGGRFPGRQRRAAGSFGPALADQPLLPSATREPMGDARREKVADVLARFSGIGSVRQLNEGNPWKMGESVGCTGSLRPGSAPPNSRTCAAGATKFFHRHLRYENAGSKGVRN
jgi:organic radical activating enzyme